jgi:hypothetical protein
MDAILVIAGRQARASWMETTMRILKISAIAAVVIACTGTAMAGPQCTTAPQAQWMTEAAMRAKIERDGYTIKTFKVSGNCYEIYGFTKDGKKVEIYFNPVDGSIVKKEVG